MSEGREASPIGRARRLARVSGPYPAVAARVGTNFQKARALADPMETAPVVGIIAAGFGPNR